LFGDGLFSNVALVDLGLLATQYLHAEHILRLELHKHIIISYSRLQQRFIVMLILP